MGIEWRASHDAEDDTSPRPGRTLDRSEPSAATPSVPWPVNVGEVVDGKYRIERALGTGGMGVVLAARHLTLGEPVALKFVRWEHADADHLAARLKREALATFRLRSEHAVRTMDVGQLPSGAIYIVMELLEGQDFRTVLQEQGTLPEREAVAYALQVCHALEDAHGLGIIHRDLKPQNLFLTRRPRGGSILKVLDFGVSKLDPSQFDAAPLTGPDGAVGTPRYMAPEQWSGASQVDARSDLWALGMILYEMLTGAVPHDRRRPEERRALLLAGAIPSLRTLRPDITPAVETVVLRCLRADPDKRWRSARRLAAALREARPDVELVTEGLPVTRSDVTAFDPAIHRPEALARAFAEGVPLSAPTRIAASQAVTPRAAPPTFPGRGGLPEPPPRDEFDEATEVSVPRFTEDELPAVLPIRHGPTLRSFEALPDLLPTVQVAAVPAPTRSAPPAAVAAAPQPAASTSYAPPAFRSVPPAPSGAPPAAPGVGAPRSPGSARTVGLVILGLLQSLAVVLAIVLLATRC
jgi:serine/threonine protein kinase